MYVIWKVFSCAAIPFVCNMKCIQIYVHGYTHQIYINFILLIVTEYHIQNITNRISHTFHTFQVLQFHLYVTWNVYEHMYMHMYIYICIHSTWDLLQQNITYRVSHTFVRERDVQNIRYKKGMCVHRCSSHWSITYTYIIHAKYTVHTWYIV